MQKIEKHPILKVPEKNEHLFYFNDKAVVGTKGFTIAAALHQAGFPVHSHSLDNRKRSLECGIGKCGACEMLVDGKIKRICILKLTELEKLEKFQKILNLVRKKSI